MADLRFRRQGLPEPREDEDLASYDVGDGFSWPKAERGGKAPRPVAAIPPVAKDRPSFDEAALLAMARALEADGRPAAAIAGAVQAVIEDIARIHDLVRFEGKGGPGASDAACRDEFVARRHASYADSPEGILALPAKFHRGSHW